MGLETGTRIADLVATNPVGATDFVSQGDDHIRLIKACIQGSLPNLGATAVSVAAEKLNFTADVTSLIQAQLDALSSGKQPLDADLTAIAALTTQGYGRSLLTQVDAAAARTTIDVYSKAQIDAGVQPLDSDLTAIAALVTATYGRDFLTLANNAALATKIAALVPTWTGQHDFTAGYANTRYGTRIAVNGAAGLEFFRTDVSANLGKYAFEVGNGSLAFYALTDNHGTTNIVYRVTRDSSAAITEFYVPGPTRIPKIAPSTSTTLVTGQIHNITGNATLPAIGDGEWVCIVNNSGSPITITEHSGDTTYWTATGASVSTLTVPARGRIVASGAGSSVVYVSGDISGVT